VTVRRLTPFLLLPVLLGCNARLPEPESPGGRLYAERCGSCHRLYAPQSMKAPMWEMTLQRMQGELARRGVPPLKPDEYETLLAYLERHSDR
jgi:Dihaem cytochrome c